MIVGCRAEDSIGDFANIFSIWIFGRFLFIVYKCKRNWSPSIRSEFWIESRPNEIEGGFVRKNDLTNSATFFN